MPKNIQELLSKVDVLLEIPRVSLAEKELKALMQLAPDSVDVFRRMMTLRMLQNRYIECRSFSEMVLAKYPQDFNARHVLAVCMSMTGEVLTAIDMWRKLLKEFPTSGFVHACLADMYLWRPDMGVSADEAEIHLKEALLYSPNSRLVKEVEFWLAQRKEDLPRMEAVIADIQRMFPAEKIAARLLGKFIQMYKPEDSKVIPSLLKMFPDDPDLLLMAKEANHLAEQTDAIKKMIFNIFTVEKKDDTPSRVLKEAEVKGEGFGVRKVARVLREFEDKDTSALIALLLDLTVGDITKQTALLGYIKHLFYRVPKTAYDRMISQVFSLGFVQLYPFVLTDLSGHPTEETWDKIWPQIEERPELLEKVLDKYFAFNPHPPVSLDLIFEASGGDLKTSRLKILRDFLRQEPNQINLVWKTYIDRAPSQTSEANHELLGVISESRLESLCDAPQFVDQLIQFTERAENFKLNSTHWLWNRLASIPPAFLKKLESQPNYNRLIEKLFAFVLDVKTEDAIAAPVSCFLEKLPGTRIHIDTNKERMTQRIDEINSSELHRSLVELKGRGTPEIDHAAIERQNLADTRKELEAMERDILKREIEAHKKEIENETKAKIIEVTTVHSKITALQTEFQVKMAEIQNSQMSPEDKAIAIQSAANELQNKMKAALT